MERGRASSSACCSPRAAATRVGGRSRGLLVWPAVVLACVALVAMARLDGANAVANDTRFFMPAECYNSTERKCCPAFGGDVCGGVVRGSCELVLDDDGLTRQCNGRDPLSVYWITDWFDYACTCNGNYWGAGCELCLPGWTGDDCQTAMPMRVRRDIDTLDDAEIAKFVRGIHLLTVTDHPYWPGEISIWRWLGAVHAWAKDPHTQTGASLDGVDFGHQGPGMLTWHRAFQWYLEYYMQVVLEDDSFTVPYWNWTKSTAGSPADKALYAMGGDGDPDSLLPISCATYYPALIDDIQCNCSVTSGHFANLTTIGYWGADVLLKDGTPMPLQRAFGCLTQAFPDLQIPASMAFVNNALEGTNYVDMTRPIQLVHSVAHNWVGWTMKLGGSHSDPSFFLHHSFIDLLMEGFLRKQMAAGVLDVGNMHPLNGTTVGHNLDECMAPFFPLTRHVAWMKPSYAFGYTFDTWEAVDPAVTTAYVASGTDVFFTSTTTATTTTTSRRQRRAAIATGAPIVSAAASPSSSSSSSSSQEAQQSPRLRMRSKRHARTAASLQPAGAR